MRDLRLSLRGLPADDVTSTAVLVTGTPTIDGASVVTLDRAALPHLSRRLRTTFSRSTFPGRPADKRRTI